MSGHNVQSRSTANVHCYLVPFHLQVTLVSRLFAWWGLSGALVGLQHPTKILLGFDTARCLQATSQTKQPKHIISFNPKSPDRNHVEQVGPRCSSTCATTTEPTAKLALLWNLGA